MLKKSPIDNGLEYAFVVPSTICLSASQYTTIIGQFGINLITGEATILHGAGGSTRIAGKEHSAERRGHAGKTAHNLLVITVNSIRARECVLFDKAFYRPSKGVI